MKITTKQRNVTFSAIILFVLVMSLVVNQLATSEPIEPDEVTTDQMASYIYLKIDGVMGSVQSPADFQDWSKIIAFQFSGIAQFSQTHALSGVQLTPFVVLKEFDDGTLDTFVIFTTGQTISEVQVVLFEATGREGTLATTFKYSMTNVIIKSYTQTTQYSETDILQKIETIEFFFGQICIEDPDGVQACSVARS